jgi:hypothetical protein
LEIDMRALVPLFVAALVGAVTGVTFAEAREPELVPRPVGPAVCRVTQAMTETTDFINESLAAGRDEFLSVQALVCSW